MRVFSIAMDIKLPHHIAALLCFGVFLRVVDLKASAPAFAVSTSLGSVSDAKLALAVRQVDVASGGLATHGSAETQSLPAWRQFVFGFSLGLMVWIFQGCVPAAWAADTANGENVFLGNCAACHAGGNNAVQPDKKLKKEALVQYGMYDVDSIKYQVTNGKNAMPAFGDRLKQTDIDDVANYVIMQADKGWLANS